jgi:CRISPR/Cas system CMR-associated protein Cmr5 small subunit
MQRLTFWHLNQDNPGILKRANIKENGVHILNANMLAKNRIDILRYKTIKNEAYFDNESKHISNFETISL